MLRRIIASVLMGACALSFTSLASAQDPAAPGDSNAGPGTKAPRAGGPRRGGPTSQPGGRMGGGMMFAGMADQLKLTEEQKPKFDTITAEYQKKVAAAMETNKEKLQQLRDRMQTARDAKDETAMKAVMDEMRALTEQTIKPLTEQTIAELKAILTPEQQAKLDELKTQTEQRRVNFGRQGGQGGGMAAVFQQLNLSPDQQKQMEEAQTALREKMQAGERTPENMKAAFEEFQAKMKTILTPEQQQKLEELRAQRQQNAPQPPANPAPAAGASTN